MVQEQRKVCPYCKRIRYAIVWAIFMALFYYFYTG